MIENNRTLGQDAGKDPADGTFSQTRFADDDNPWPGRGDTVRNQARVRQDGPKGPGDHLRVREHRKAGC